MSTKIRKQKNRRPLIKIRDGTGYVTDSTFVTLLTSLKDESSLGVVLISAIAIEEALVRLLLGFLVRCKASENTLARSNFNSRVALARACGLISEKEYGILNAFGLARNKMAHEVFSPKHLKRDLASLVSTLKATKIWTGSPEETPREWFESFVVWFVFELDRRRCYNKDQGHQIEDDE